MKRQQWKTLFNMTNITGMSRYLVTYTVVFSIIFTCSYHIFFIEAKSFIWSGDGYIQHFPSLIYIGKYYRNIISSMMAGKLVVPMYDFSIGMGSDILSVLNYYGMGDAFLFLSIFVPLRYSEFFYNFLVVFRLYCSGISFSCYCFYMGKRKKYTLIGCLLYVFCSYAVYYGLRHPFFINPMVYFPLLIIGMDKILKKEKPHFFLIISFFSVLTGFYFYYMVTIYLFFHLLFRFFILYKVNRLKEFSYACLRCIGAYLLSLMLASFHFIPSIIGYFNSPRITKLLTLNSLLCFNVTKYISVLIGFISVSGDGDSLGGTAIVLFAIVLLFLNRQKHLRSLKIGFLLALAVMLIPGGSYIMNGFGYVSFRWIFMFSFLIGYIVVTMLPVIMNMNKQNIFPCLLILLIYGIIYLIGIKRIDSKQVFPVFMLLLSFAVIINVPFNYLTRYKYNKSGVTKYTLLLATVSINLILNTNYLYNNKGEDFSSFYMAQSDALNNLLGSRVLQNMPLDSDSFYRIDTRNRERNESMIFGYHSTSIYFSIINKYYSEFLQNQEVAPSLSYVNSVRGFDDRTFLNALSAIKYKIPNNVDSYGYKVYQNREDVYENHCLLPIIYSYPCYLTNEDVKKLSPLEKQEIMMQAAILEEELIGYCKAQTRSLLRPINFNIEFDGVSIEGEKLIVEKQNGSLVLNFESLPNSETYVRFVGLINEATDYLSIDLLNDQQKGKYFRVLSKYDTYYYGAENYIVNLGYKQDLQNHCVITFREEGIYSIKGIELYNQPMNAYEKQIALLKSDIVENIQIDTNRVFATVYNQERKILCMSIPYSKGWTAYVDGKKTEIKRVNEMYMALLLEPGRHQIMLRYSTPGSKLGILISGLGLLSLITIAGLEKIKNSRLQIKKQD